MFGRLGYDLFATIINAKCKKIFSLLLEPGTSAVDVFIIKWTELNFCAFPLFALILEILIKIKNNKAEAILVVLD